MEEHGDDPCQAFVEPNPHFPKSQPYQRLQFFS
jgi:hypothetical protein